MGNLLVRDDTSSVSYVWEPDPPPSEVSGETGSGGGQTGNGGGISGGGFEGGLYNGGYRNYGSFFGNETYHVSLPGDPDFRGWGSSQGRYYPPNRGTTGGGGGGGGGDITVIENPTSPADTSSIPGYDGYDGDYESGTWDEKIDNEDGSTEHYVTIVNSSDNSDGSRTVTMTTMYIRTNADGSTEGLGRTQTATISAAELARIRNR